MSDFSVPLFVSRESLSRVFCLTLTEMKAIGDGVASIIFSARSVPRTRSYTCGGIKGERGGFTQREYKGRCEGILCLRYSTGSTARRPKRCVSLSLTHRFDLISLLTHTWPEWAGTIFLATKSDGPFHTGITIFAEKLFNYAHFFIYDSLEMLFARYVPLGNFKLTLGKRVWIKILKPV